MRFATVFLLLALSASAVPFWPFDYADASQPSVAASAGSAVASGSTSATPADVAASSKAAGEHPPSASGAGAHDGCGERGMWNGTHKWNATTHHPGSGGGHHHSHGSGHGKWNGTRHPMIGMDKCNGAHDHDADKGKFPINGTFIEMGKWNGTHAHNHTYSPADDKGNGSFANSNTTVTALLPYCDEEDAADPSASAAGWYADPSATDSSAYADPTPSADAYDDASSTPTATDNGASADSTPTPADTDTDTYTDGPDTYADEPTPSPAGGY